MDQWEDIRLLAKKERRSATSQLAVVIARGLGGSAGLELSMLSDERSEKLMAGVKRS